jgi:hypothetical protein
MLEAQSCPRHAHRHGSLDFVFELAHVSGHQYRENMSSAPELS